ncbi:3174_t:CDS:2 [Entrophospora sp. SA101]|nr:13961_t:CDS:2 [Entrophospora sp. SA101]CAJ0745005.1 3174_t:CDS:2 [Entrophospora sp. SA101]CAJ0823344.1 4366_t:CDS:2 [Entrophospora sp. SA101]
MHSLRWVLSFLLLFGTFTEFALSCFPKIIDNYISISHSISPNWRVNVVMGFLNPGTKIITFNSGNIPAFNEVFVLTQSNPGIYEIQPFWDFNQNAVIEIPSGSKIVGDSVQINTIINNNNNRDNQKFSIECDVCDIQTSSKEDWVPFHTKCTIKGADSVANVTQDDCANAQVWNILGKLDLLKHDTATSTTAPTNSPTVAPITSPSTVSTSDIQISMAGAVGIILGSIVGTALIVLVTVYYLFIRHQRSTDANKSDRVNVQVFSG